MPAIHPTHLPGARDTAARRRSVSGGQGKVMGYDQENGGVMTRWATRAPEKCILRGGCRRWLVQANGKRKARGRAP